MPYKEEYYSFMQHKLLLAFTYYLPIVFAYLNGQFCHADKHIIFLPHTIIQVYDYQTIKQKNLSSVFTKLTKTIPIFCTDIYSFICFCMQILSTCLPSNRRNRRKLPLARGIFHTFRCLYCAIYLQLR